MTSRSETIMAKREIKRGDIVKIRKEWLNPGEDESITYVVLEERGDSHVLVQALGTGLPLAPTYVYDTDWIEHIGTARAGMNDYKSIK